MKKNIARLVVGFLALLVLLILFTSIFGPIWTRKTAEKSFPQTDGEVQLPDLNGRVEIYRDDMGVPHIFATTEHDLFLAQGYIHAQDRFWQMDFWRHQGAGRLSELLGKNLLETDRFLRTLGWERVAREELTLMDAESLEILDSYSEGVNTYLEHHTGNALALEYAFLPILNRGYSPEAWTPLNTMTWAKAMAWNLGGNMDTEIRRALLLNDLSPQQVDQLYPPYPEDRPQIVTHPHLTREDASVIMQETSWIPLIKAGLAEIQEQMMASSILSQGDFEGIGSNSWVVSGDLTDTGMPILANDPHLSSQIPSIWYEVGLHCVAETPDCRINVSGFSFAGTPGVIIGHNNSIAWGLTNVAPDVMDLYIEKINPENPNQYEFKGSWVEMETVVEEIKVAGGETVKQTVRLTRHGPIITEVYGLEDFAEKAGVEVPENFAISMRWTALEPSCVFCAVWNFNKAQNWDEFRAAAFLFAVPSQNLVYADVEGNIGYQMPGNIPIRSANHDGMLPVPGWTGEYEWLGYIPYEELPYAYNPIEGYIVTANNAVVGPEYPYSISRQWAAGQRAQAILDMLENIPGPISVEVMKEMQGDNRMLIAEDLVPVLMEVSLDEDSQQEIRNLFEGWDFQMDMDSAPGALFAVFWKNLLSRIYHDDLPESYWPSGGGIWMEIVRQLIDDPVSPWWDDRTTEAVETRDDIFRKAFSDAVDEIQKLEGKKPENWAWGDFHTITFEHGVMTSLPVIKTAFNRGPFQTSGGSAIVNATGWSTGRGYQVGGVPSMRMVVDLSDLSNSWTMHTTGQSGHPYHPNYIDMVDPWRFIQYHPMYWDRDVIETNTHGHLTLLPGGD